MTRPPLVDDALCRLAHAQDAPSRALVHYVAWLEAEWEGRLDGEKPVYVTEPRGLAVTPAEAEQERE
jgi:hypothetical protein